MDSSGNGGLNSQPNRVGQESVVRVGNIKGASGCGLIVALPGRQMPCGGLGEEVEKGLVEGGPHPLQFLRPAFPREVLERVLDLLDCDEFTFSLLIKDTVHVCGMQAARSKV